MKFVSKSLKDTQNFAGEVLKKLGADEKSYFAQLSPTSQRQRATVLLLEGDLGSGKTTFVQFLAQALGVKENLTSPTFVLMKSYKVSSQKNERIRLSIKNLVHIDAYRLTSGQDLKNLGWDKLVTNPDNLIVVEWPELVADLWDGSELKIKFKFVDEKTREIDTGRL